MTEAGGVANGTPGTPTATGDLNSTDVDNPADAWTAVGTATASANGYGSYTLTAAGVWTYTLDNSNAAVQALNAGQTLTDSFTVTTVDGTAQLVTITINGANDAAVITGAASGSVTEAGGVANGTPGTPTATGNLNSTDVDNPNDAWTAVATATASANGYGTYTLTAAGVWTYTLDNSNAAVQALNVGGTLTDTFTATTVDGTAQLVTITINGANDAAVITGDRSRHGGRGRRRRQRHAGHADRDRRSELDRRRQCGRCLDRGRHGDRQRQWLRHLHPDRRRGVDLHARQQQRDRAGAQCRRHADRHVHRHHGRRHRPAGDDHHQRRQRCGCDHRDRDGSGDRSRRRRQRHARHAHRDRQSQFHRRRQSADGWNAVGSPTASANGYGSYTLTAAGVWTYTLDNSNAAVQALNAGGTLTDTFTATTVDGTAQGRHHHHHRRQ